MDQTRPEKIYLKELNNALFFYKIIFRVNPQLFDNLIDAFTRYARTQSLPEVVSENLAKKDGHEWKGWILEVSEGYVKESREQVESDVSELEKILNSPNNIKRRKGVKGLSSQRLNEFYLGAIERAIYQLEQSLIRVDQDIERIGDSDLRLKDDLGYRGFVKEAEFCPPQDFLDQPIKSLLEEDRTDMEEDIKRLWEYRERVLKDHQQGMYEFEIKSGLSLV
ncbi:MAG: hypothetical protein WCV90_03515 [Candidatus Woesearchaeota archaeon]|jgi:hypothetical protein